MADQSPKTQELSPELIQKIRKKEIAGSGLEKVTKLNGKPRNVLPEQNLLCQRKKKLNKDTSI